MKIPVSHCQTEGPCIMGDSDSMTQGGLCFRGLFVKVSTAFHFTSTSILNGSTYSRTTCTHPANMKSLNSVVGGSHCLPFITKRGYRKLSPVCCKTKTLKRTSTIIPKVVGIVSKGTQCQILLVTVRIHAGFDFIWTTVLLHSRLVFGLSSVSQTRSTSATSSSLAQR